MDPREAQIRRDREPFGTSTGNFGGNPRQPTRHEQLFFETLTVDDVNAGSREIPEDPEKSTEYIHGVKLALVIVSISVVYFLNMLDTTVLATVRLHYTAINNLWQRDTSNLINLATNYGKVQAIPYITDEFHSILDIGWYGSAYTLAT